MMIYIPPTKNDLENNIIQIQLFLRELKYLQGLFDHSIQERDQALKEEGILQPVLHITKFLSKDVDCRINLAFKCYLFVLKQTIDKLFFVCYLMRKPLGFENVKKLFPHVRGKKFQEFIKKISQDRQEAYDYDADILKILFLNTDLFILLTFPNPLNIHDSK